MEVGWEIVGVLGARQPEFILLRLTRAVKTTKRSCLGREKGLSGLLSTGGLCQRRPESGWPLKSLGAPSPSPFFLPHPVPSCLGRAPPVRQTQRVWCDRPLQRRLPGSLPLARGVRRRGSGHRQSCLSPGPAPVPPPPPPRPPQPLG